MATRRPLILDTGTMKELPVGDSVIGATSDTYIEPVMSSSGEIVTGGSGDIAMAAVTYTDLTN